MISWLIIKAGACAAAAFFGYRIWHEKRKIETTGNSKPIDDTVTGEDANALVANSNRSLTNKGSTRPVDMFSKETLLAKNDLYLKLAGVSLASSAGASLLASPLLYIYSAGIITWAMWPRYKEGARKLLKEHRASGDLLYTILLPLAVLTGQVFPGGLAALVSILGDRYKIKSEDEVRARLSDMLNSQFDKVWVETSAGEKQIPVSEIQPNDVVVVHTGEMVPIDGTVTDGFATIDQHVLTGESQPVEKAIGDKIFASTLVVAGKVYARVDSAGAETTAAQLANILDNTLHYTTQHVESKAIHRTDAQVLPVLMVGAGAASLAGIFPAASLLMAWTPGRMRLASGLTMLNYMEVASRRGILIKDGRALELLKDVDVVIFDKTGTLTNDQPRLYDVHSCNGYAPVEVLRYAAAAETKLTHPIARAIQEKAKDLQLALPGRDQSSYELGYGIRMVVQGKSVKVGSEMFMQMEGIAIPQHSQRLSAKVQEQGHSIVFVALDEGLVGLLEIRASVRPESRKVIHTLRELSGAHISIVSGDSFAPTEQLANDLGVDSFMAEMLPQDKARHIERLQNDGNVVCFVGDGINDSIALKQAHVGISMSGASNIATETAQIVLMNPNLSGIVDVFRISDDLSRSADRNSTLTCWTPGIIGSGMALFAGVGILPVVLVNTTCLVAGIGNAMLPLRDEKNADGN